ncbi:protein tyrosine phosphatase [Aphanizomenon flos-aquae 2012/KM1/D3]|nr:protein tyrosine phosphatase [Aphanizomenon flos-aquae 2012/KM1/D3]
MNHLIDQARLNNTILCDSAGTAGYHIGAAPDRRMSAASENKLGFKLIGQARQFQIRDFQEFDLILAMDRNNYDDILAVDRSGQYHSKVRLMCDFCSTHTLKEVPDPYYGGVEGFNHVIDLLMDACEGLLKHITEN